jgi:type IX secretion system substrate protein/parallel beta helix pectate lyase-like protein
MKKYLLLLPLMIIALKMFGQTYISGIIGSNANWTVPNSPYIVTGNTVLMPGFTITIDPGVTVQFDANVELDVRGTLIAQGTVLDTIHFIPSGTSRWSGFRVSNNYGAKVDFKFVKATYSSTLLDVVTSGGTGDTLIKAVNCIFNDVGTVIDEQDVSKTHYVFIDSCTVSNNTYYTCMGASNFFVYNSKFINNYRVFYNSTSQFTIIDNCDFIGNYDYAILVVGTVTNSRFYNNHIAIATMNGNYPLLHYNDIYSNDVGIEAWNFGSPNPTTQITNNRICNNLINVKKIYNPDTYVIDNCWCLTDSVQIEATIYDFFDNSGLGIVYFSPFDTTCQNISSGISEPINNFTLKVFPNPFINSLNIALNNYEHSEITIYDFTSRKVINKSFVNSSSISTEQLSKGVYIYEVKCGNEFFKRGKLVKD